jgi:hypothetical protein
MKLYISLLISLILLGACTYNPTSAPKEKGWWFNWGEKQVATPAIPPPRSCFTQAPSARPTATTFLLAIGANVGGLKETNADAKKFKEFMQKYYAIPEAQTCFLDNSYRQELVNALERLTTLLNQQDLAIIYFSGHGSYVEDTNGDEQQDEVLVTYDVEGQSLQDDCKNYGLVDDDWVKLVNALPTAKVLTVLDACHSGGMYMPVQEDLLPQARLKFYAKGCLGMGLSSSSSFLPTTKPPWPQLKGLLLTASRKGEKSFELPGEGGIFTSRFLAALKGTPPEKMREAFEHAQQQVTAEILSKKNMSQQPTFRGDWTVVVPVVQ